MKEFLLSNRIRLWVVDNLASLSSGSDENSKQEWDPINTWLLDLRFAVSRQFFFTTQARMELNAGPAPERTTSIFRLR